METKVTGRRDEPTGTSARRGPGFLSAAARALAESLTLLMVLLAVPVAIALALAISDTWQIGTEPYSPTFYKLFLECLAVCLVGASKLASGASLVLRQREVAEEAHLAGWKVGLFFGIAGSVLAGVAALDQWQVEHRGIAWVSVGIAVLLAADVIFKVARGRPRSRAR